MHRHYLSRWVAALWAAMSLLPAQAAEGPYSHRVNAGDIAIQAAQVHFEGQDIVLDGAMLTHDAGSVTATQARFRADSLSSRAVTEVELEQNVRVDLAKGGTLSCWHALIDTKAKEGRFSGLLPLQRVCYKEPSLCVESHTMKARLKPEGGQATLREALSVIQAEGSVTLSTDAFEAKAESLVYWRTPPIDAPALIWQKVDALCDLLCFERDVQLKAKGLQLDASETVWIARTGTTEKPVFSSLVASGPSVVEMVESDALSKRLVCPGEIIVETDARQAFLKGTDDKQLFYEDQASTVYADEMVIDFAMGQKDLKPKQITLQGNVCIHNSKHLGTGPLQIRYALADYVVYSPGDETMLLSGSNGKRVLFVDEAGHTKGSAPRVSVDRKAGLIEAHGALRLTLNEEETQRLMQQFTGIQ